MKRTALVLIVSLCAGVPCARAGETGSLAAVVPEDDRVEFHLSSPARERVRFEKDPPRLLIDWENTSLTAAAQNFEGRGRVFKSVRVGQLSTDPTPVVRAVVEMSAYAIYSIDWDGNVMHLAMGDAAMRPRPLKEEGARAGRPAIPARTKVPARTAQAQPAKKVDIVPKHDQPSKLPPPSLGGSGAAAKAPDQAAATPPVKPKTQAELVKAQPGQDKSPAPPPANALPKGLGDARPPASTAPQPAPAVKPAAAAKPEPAAAKPQPEPKVSPKASGRFLVQVGSFGEEARAEALKKSIEGAVSPVEVVKVDVSGKVFYQVRVGPFEGHPAADEVFGKLKGLGYAGSFVVTKK
ncbi:MAG: SPOR domain-containing protein [Elusimicrobia bacterium]|nr:SPOR domain-containing protein [Elusimicrobiota bacterium]